MRSVMHANEVVRAINPDSRERPNQIASWGRLVGFLLIGVGVVMVGFLAQHAPSGTGGANGSQLANHGKAITIYLSLIAMDWALLYYCWAAVHHYGGGLTTLSGGSWTSWKSLSI